MSALLARLLFLLAVTLMAAAAQAATLNVSPTSVAVGGNVWATWSGITTPTSTDWIGLYAPGAANSPAISQRYTTGAASGNVPFTIPSNLTPGTYQLRLFANGGDTLLATSNNFTVTVPSLSASPASVLQGGTVVAAWSGIPTPSTADWIGMYAPGAADQAYWTWRYTTGAASGNVPFSIPAGTAFGTYELRLFANGGYTRLAVSNSFTVNATVSGTVTAGGSPLAGVALAATNGGSCTASSASGQYTCTVPTGWSGSVTPSLSGYRFTPAKRNYSNLTANQTVQDYAGAPISEVSGTVTLSGSPLAGVTFAASNGGSCTSSNASGQYTCTVPQGWSGSVTPTLSNHAFTPASRSYSSVTANQSAQDYAAATQAYDVSGTVKLNGVPLRDVVLAATNGGTCTQSNALGQYNCTVPPGWSGSVTPSASGYSFTPASRSYANVGNNQTVQDFAAALVSASAPIFYIHADHLNTPRLVADATGTTVWRWDQQEPFGNNVVDENPNGLGAFDLPLRLPGQYFDKETNVHYNYFRDYDPGIGRYKQSDPIGLQGGLNTYAYVRSNPLSYFDPDGLEVRYICRLVRGLRFFQHCFVYITCPEEGWASTLSLYGHGGILPRVSYKAANEGPDNPNSSNNEYDQPVPPRQCYADACGYEKSVLRRFNSFPSGFVPYTATGPNSNSFATDLVGGVPPAGAPGSIAAPGIGMPHPAFPR